MAHCGSFTWNACVDCHAEGPIPVTSGPVSITSPVLITSARLLGGAAVVILSVAGCTSVTGGDPTVNAVDAPVYRTSVSLSSSQSVASASARESERQASMTIQAVHATCETLSTTSADAIDAVNAYVGAFNKEGGDLKTTEGPAADALNQSAEAVEGSITEVVPAELKDAFTAWVDGARTAADAINRQATPKEFNKIIDGLNDARSTALRLCDATYR